MSKQLLDFDLLSHTATYHEYDPIEDRTIITTIQDVEPYLKRSQTLRNDDDYSTKGIKEDMWHYASIPNSIIDKMLEEDGVDVFNKHQSKEVLTLLNTKYQHLKMTRKRHC